MEYGVLVSKACASPLSGNGCVWCEHTLVMAHGWARDEATTAMVPAVHATVLDSSGPAYSHTGGTAGCANILAQRASTPQLDLGR